MQYDENAEKYGYEGEMTPIECDKLKPYTYDDMIDGDADTNIEYYPKSDADAIIAQKDFEIDRLKAKLEDVQASAYAESVDAGMRERRLCRAVWLARAERAKAMYIYWHVKCIEGHLLYAHKWIVVERLCRAKAEEYK